MTSTAALTAASAATMPLADSADASLPSSNELMLMAAHTPIEAAVPGAALLRLSSSPLKIGLLGQTERHSREAAESIEPLLTRNLNALREIVTLGVQFLTDPAARERIVEPLENSLHGLRAELHPLLRRTLGALAAECAESGHKELEFGLLHLQHDCGTACTKVYSLCQTLVEDYRDGRFDEDFTAGFETRLIRALNKFPSDVDAVERSIELEEVSFADLGTWITGMVRESEHYMEEPRRLRCVTEVTGEAEAWNGFAHRGVAMRAVGEFVRNSARAMNGAGTGVRFTARITPAEIRLTVSDDGKGIAPELLPTIFENGVSTRNGGGLGLAIVAESAAFLNGAVHVKTKPGQGSSFSLIVPTRLDLE